MRYLSEGIDAIYRLLEYYAQRTFFASTGFSGEPKPEPGNPIGLPF